MEGSTMKAFMSEPWGPRANPLDVDVDCFGYGAHAEAEARAILAESEPQDAKVAFPGPYDAFIVEHPLDDQETHYYADVTCYAALAEALSSFLES